MKQANANRFCAGKANEQRIAGRAEGVDDVVEARIEETQALSVEEVARAFQILALVGKRGHREVSGARETPREAECEGGQEDYREATPRGHCQDGTAPAEKKRAR